VGSKTQLCPPGLVRNKYRSLSWWQVTREGASRRSFDSVLQDVKCQQSQMRSWEETGDHKALEAGKCRLLRTSGSQDWKGLQKLSVQLPKQGCSLPLKQVEDHGADRSASPRVSQLQALEAPVTIPHTRPPDASHYPLDNFLCPHSLHCVMLTHCQQDLFGLYIFKHI
jgi:hypothetical protein